MSCPSCSPCLVPQLLRPQTPRRTLHDLKSKGRECPSSFRIGEWRFSLEENWVAGVCSSATEQRNARFINSVFCQFGRNGAWNWSTFSHYITFSRMGWTFSICHSILFSWYRLSQNLLFFSSNSPSNAMCGMLRSDHLKAVEGTDLLESTELDLILIPDFDTTAGSVKSLYRLCPWTISVQRKGLRNHLCQINVKQYTCVLWLC